MAAIHHATAKKAAAHGIGLTIRDDGKITATGDGAVLATGTDAKDVLTAAIEAMDNGAADEADDDDAAAELEAEAEAEGEPQEDGDEDEKVDRSVVKNRYKQRYRPFKDRCGDEISKLISSHVWDEDEDRIDPVKLQKFAKANDVWDAKYANLNVGMQRMNIANKLRGRIRREDYQVRWA